MRHCLATAYLQHEQLGITAQHRDTTSGRSLRSRWSAFGSTLEFECYTKSEDLILRNPSISISLLSAEVMAVSSRMLNQDTATAQVSELPTMIPMICSLPSYGVWATILDVIFSYSHGYSSTFNSLAPKLSTSDTLKTSFDNLTFVHDALPEAQHRLPVLAKSEISAA